MKRLFTFEDIYPVFFSCGFFFTIPLVIIIVWYSSAEKNGG